jgi:hypothetical protein
MSESGTTGTERTIEDVREIVATLAEALSTAPPAADDEAAEALGRFRQSYAAFPRAVEILEVSAGHDAGDETALAFAESLYGHVQMVLDGVRAWSADQVRR